MHKTLFLHHDTPSYITRQLSERRAKTPDMETLREVNDHLVFVYGSLMSGFHNNYLLNKTKFLGNGRSLFDKFEMYAAHSFPVLREVAPDLGNYVYGEIYGVSPDVMMTLDGLEANGHMYTRKKIRVKMTDQVLKTENPTVRANYIEECWCYLGNEEYWEFNKMKEVPLMIRKENKESPGLVWTKPLNRHSVH